ncbi:uncharacterized protein PGTG_05441 [Puccinia graminis f. sp. tritici CRL 75-36-700-3]|uniref:Uncharacterized protein n=1 Tax=Puccinia graminis f. sp. tritici (strain CRL 75-36-700-3 / race SCCL) TaxID=418459 RepID=E3K4B0_PUCGT|nr:uncharacterized protein PGTG_05441 [Puccinia graminis f. sp. tritici CRL 75-36-700-3]EFP79120.1 hypothetical protein PGTG_05441 [Puccinia graminis f. sp. tritici CRL 75-36-700-3]
MANKTDISPPKRKFTGSDTSSDSPKCNCLETAQLRSDFTFSGYISKTFPDHEIASIDSLGIWSSQRGNYDGGFNYFYQVCQYMELNMNSQEFPTSAFLHVRFDLTRCCLALLDPTKAIDSLTPCLNWSVPYGICFGHELWETLSILYTSAKRLKEHRTNLDLAFESGNWSEAIQTINQVATTRLKNFPNASIMLPGQWSYWKAEALAQVGKVTESKVVIS